jgi:hypothetical protein
MAEPTMTPAELAIMQQYNATLPNRVCVPFNVEAPILEDVIKPHLLAQGVPLIRVPVKLANSTFYYFRDWKQSLELFKVLPL